VRLTLTHHDHQYARRLAPLTKTMIAVMKLQVVAMDVAVDVDARVISVNAIALVLAFTMETINIIATAAAR